MSCAAKHNNSNRAKKKEKQAKENPVEWSSNIAYLTGLIVSDGTLHREKPRIGFTSSDFELIKHVKAIVKSELTGKIYKPQKCSLDGSVWWKYQFTSREYYFF